MKHKLKISASKQPQTGGIVTCRNLTVRERLLRFILGDKRRVTVLIPGDSVGEMSYKLWELVGGLLHAERVLIDKFTPI